MSGQFWIKIPFRERVPDINLYKYKMATFNTSTGCISGTTPLCPPFATDAQLTAYVAALDAITKSPAPSIKTKNSLVVKDTSKIGTPGEGAIITTASGSEGLPSVMVWQLDGITAAVIYVDASGNSSFAYKNDPTGRIKLIQGGATIPAAPKSSKALDITQSGAPTSSGSPYLAVILACCILVLMAAGVMFVMKK
jgi:hypothetical protein